MITNINLQCKQELLCQNLEYLTMYSLIKPNNTVHCTTTKKIKIKQ